MKNNDTKTSTLKLDTTSPCYIDPWHLFLTFNTLKAEYKSNGQYESRCGYETIDGIVYKRAKINFQRLEKQLKAYKRNMRFQELGIG